MQPAAAAKAVFIMALALTYRRRTVGIDLRKPGTGANTEMRIDCRHIIDQATDLALAHDL